MTLRRLPPPIHRAERESPFMDWAADHLMPFVLAFFLCCIAGLIVAAA